MTASACIYLIRFTIFIVIFFKAPKSFGQNEKLMPASKTQDSVKTNYKPELLSSGFFDIVNSGQLNAAARFLRLFIGEPGKFAIPLSIYSGVSSNNFQSAQDYSGIKSNEHLINNFINPLSGMVNISADGMIYFPASQKKLTRAAALYHFGEKILTGYKTGVITDPATGRPINFLNSFASGGMYFQTGAWERNNAKNIGIFWMNLRYLVSYTKPKQLRQMIPSINTNGIYHGYIIGWGVEINQLVNIKLLYYQYVKTPEIEYGLPIYQFSFNYALK